MPESGEKVLLSAPRATEEDIEAVIAALRSGWLAPAGPDLSLFEEEVARFIGVAHAVALSSGTAALHLGLKYLGVKPGDCVLVPTATFAATAFAVTYLRAIPIFIDSEESSWNLDPQLVESAVLSLRQAGHRVTAAIPVDLYGAPADYSALSPLLESLEINWIEDAAEGLGSTHGNAQLGSFGRGGILSFNGNKLITTSGGGMLVTNDPLMAERVRFWSTQSREDSAWYEHKEVGYNYRLSNILAALGRSQLNRATDEVRARQRIREDYRGLLCDFPGVTVQADPMWGVSNAWLTVARFDKRSYPNAPTRIRLALEQANIESRPIWKPMHRQPVFQSNPSFVSGVADQLFMDGLCLPSGSSVTPEQVARICETILGVLRGIRVS